MTHFALGMSLIVATWFNDPDDLGIAEDRVDLIEVNHFFDDRGKLVFDQLIYFDWSNEHDRYMVRDWRLLKTPSQLPIPDGDGGDYVAVWYDGDLLRVVRCSNLRETWTRYDPELVERDCLPRPQRAELSRPLDTNLLRR